MHNNLSQKYMECDQQCKKCSETSKNCRADCNNEGGYYKLDDESFYEKELQDGNFSHSHRGNAFLCRVHRRQRKGRRREKI